MRCFNPRIKIRNPINYRISYFFITYLKKNDERGFYMDKELYILFRKAAITDGQKEYIPVIMKETELSYRTIRALVQIINNEPDLKKEYLDTLVDPDFYTLENCIKAAQKGFTDIIPATFYADEEFLSHTGINKLPDRFCAGDQDIDSFEIKPQILYIGNEAFANCYNLEYVKMSDNLLEIYDGAFKNCEMLKLDYVPDDVYYIGNEAFANCASLTQFILPSKINKIQAKTFYKCQNMYEFSCKIPIRVGHKAFSGCSRLTNLNAVLLNTETESFANCSKLDQITLQNGIVGKRAFMGCSNLQEIFFKSGSVLEIQEDAFTGCSSLIKLNIDGYNYQMNETKGYKEITKNIRRILNNKGKIVTYCDIKNNFNVNEMLESILK